MTRIQKTAYGLVQAGIILFLGGLLLGFAVTAFPAGKAILSAHQAALGSGTFLMVLGVVWRTHMRSPAGWLAAGLWMSHYLLTAGLAVSGLATPSPLKAINGMVVIAACVAMTLFTLIAIIKLGFDASKAQSEVMMPQTGAN